MLRRKPDLDSAFQPQLARTDRATAPGDLQQQTPASGALSAQSAASLLALQRSAGNKAVTPLAESLLALQRTAGNRAVSDLVARSGEAQNAPPVRDVVDGGGQALPTETRSAMEGYLGQDFGQVRIHTGGEADASARSVGAVAYTVGKDIVFREGSYSPATEAGRHLLAHELTHVVQQRSGLVEGEPGLGELRVSNPADRFERAAERTANELGLEEARPVIGTQQPASLQRQAVDPSAAGQTVGTTPAPAMSPEREEMERVRANLTVRYGRLQAYTLSGAQSVAAIRARLLGAATTYDNAYQSYAAAIRAAGKEARNQSEWADIFVGIAIGAVVGLAMPQVILGSAIAAGVAGESIEAILGGAVKATGITEVAGSDLEPGGLPPYVLELNLYKSLERLHDQVHAAGRVGWNLFLINGAAEYAIGEIRAQEAGGELDMDPVDFAPLVQAIRAGERGTQALDGELPRLQASMDALRTSVLNAPVYSQQRMEQDIWIMWIAGLSDDDHNILDLNEIEDHLHSSAVAVLGEGSRLGVDFGWYTSEDDEREAMAAARRQADALRSQYASLGVF